MKIFIVNNFYPEEVVGGSEIQCWLLAKNLSKRGHDVSYVAIEGLTEKKQEQKEGFVVRYLSRRGGGKARALVNFYKLVKKEKPDVCYVRIFKYLAPLSWILRSLKTPIVFNTSHINDCTPSLGRMHIGANLLSVFRLIKTVVLRRLNFSALRNVNIITINKHHAALLEKEYGIKAITIYNSMEDEWEQNKTSKQNKVVWVNNIKGRKRPDLFINLSAELKDTDFEFLMIGNIQADKEYYEDIIKKGEKENKKFKYLGGKTPSEVNKILAESKILVNTCEPEGFGNNFIQAWLNKCPTITLDFDPDGIIEEKGIGYKAGSFNRMVELTKQLIYNENLRAEMGEKARTYALKNHSIEENVALYESQFKGVLSKYE